MSPTLVRPWTWTDAPSTAEVGIQLGPRFFTWTSGDAAPSSPKVIQLVLLQTVGNW